MNNAVRVAMIAAIAVSGCATQPDKLGAMDISPLRYDEYDCRQIASESERVNNRVNQLYTSLKSKADTDAWQMGVGLVLFWPTLFFLEGGDGPEAAEYRQLKGEYTALQQSSVQHKCGLRFVDLDASMKAKAEQDHKAMEKSKADQR